MLLLKENKVNTQPIEKQIHTAYKFTVQGEPWLTIQGEGPFVGRRAVFVRLGGCNLLCPMCDADYTSDRRDWEIEELAATIEKYETPFVVLTGGEPFRQPIGPLLERLLQNNRVQIETNGSLFQPIPEHPMLTVVCSPKGRYVNPELIPRISAWKYVVQHGQVNERGLPLTTLGRTDPVFLPPEGTVAPIYVQPLDEYEMGKNKLNMQTAVDSVLRFGHILCLQTHKIAGLP